MRRNQLSPIVGVGVSPGGRELYRNLLFIIALNATLRIDQRTRRPNRSIDSSAEALAEGETSEVGACQAPLPS